MKSPAYQRVVLLLTEQIQSGVFAPGERLKGEKALALAFGVGRSTLRESLRLLQEAGYLEIRNGVGSFVKAADRRIENDLSRLESVGKMIDSAGFCPGARCHKIEHILPETVWQAPLNLSPADPVVVIWRERFADDRSVAFSFTIFPERLVKNTLDNGIEGRIFEALEERCGLLIRSATTQISALDLTSPRDRQAQSLLGGPIVLLQQLHLDYNDTPVFLSLDYMRTDQMQLTLRRERL